MKMLTVAQVLQIAADIDAEQEISDAIDRFTDPKPDKLCELARAAMSAMNLSEPYNDAFNYAALGRALAAAARLELCARREVIRARLAAFVDLDTLEGSE